MEFPAWDPVLIDLPGPLDVRWYGLMYIVGFVAGNWILVRLARARFLPVAPERVADLIFYCVIGTILGGRLGYALFYDQGLVDPLRIIRIWEGGLAFHGGLIGVTIALVLFAWKHRVPAGRVADAAALATTPGIFAVRLANFVNGELYGRVTSPDTFLAMRFPTDEKATALLGLDQLPDKRERELAIQYAFGHRDWESVADRLHPIGGPNALEGLREQLDWEKVAPHVDFRHPSQLYEAAGEGLLLGLVLALLYWRTRKRPLPAWSYAAVFLVGYGVVRFTLERVRKPDDQFFDGGGDGTVLLGMTMGQTLSLVMILGGVGLLLRNVLLHRPRRDAEAVS